MFGTDRHEEVKIYVPYLLITIYFICNCMNYEVLMESFKFKFNNS